MILTVNVTKRDIKKGRAQDPHLCPVALAATREAKKKLKKMDIVSVGSFWFTIFNKDLRVIFSCKMSKKAQNFVSMFDNDKSSVSPCTLSFVGKTINI